LISKYSSGRAGLKSYRDFRETGHGLFGETVEMNDKNEQFEVIVHSIHNPQANRKQEKQSFRKWAKSLAWRKNARLCKKLASDLTMYM